MAEYVFIVTLPAARSGGTPDCGGWTFHHILPWKYFYCLGSLLGYYLTALTSNFLKNPNAPVLIPQLTVLNQKFLNIVECNAEITQKKSLIAMSEFDRLLNGLTRVSSGMTDRLANSAVPATTAKLFVECTSPFFGGFPGMEGSQRSDDPESTTEQNRPFNGDVAWWNAIKAIGDKLETSSLWAPIERKGCTDIKTARYGDKVKFKLSDANINDEIIAHLRTLITPKYNSAVLPFDVKSWISHYNGAKWSFNITHNIFEYAEYNANVSNLSFAVSTIDSHAGRKKHLEFTRCPNSSNELNRLKPTNETTKILNRHL